MQFFISTRNKDILNLHFTIPFFLIILFLKLSTAKLTVYDTNNVISSYDNVDFMGIDKTSYGTVMGKLLVASFSGPIDNDKDDPCKIKNLPLDAAIDIVVIPFQDAYDIGCESYSQIIIANNWKLNKNEVLTYPPNKAPTGGNNNEPNDNTDNGNINNNNNNNYNNNNNQVKNPPPQENQNANPKVINNDNNNINNIPNGKGVNGNVNNNNNNVNNNLNNNVNAKNNNNIPPPNNNNDIPNAAPKNNNNNNVNNGGNINNNNVPQNNNNNNNNNNNANVNNVPNDQKVPISVPNVTPLPDTPNNTPPNTTPDVSINSIPDNTNNQNNNPNSSPTNNPTSNPTNNPNNNQNTLNQGTSSIDSIPPSNNNANSNNDVVPISVVKPTLLATDAPTPTSQSQPTANSLSTGNSQPTANSQSTGNSQSTANSPSPTGNSQPTANSQSTGNSNSQSTGNPQPTANSQSTGNSQSTANSPSPTSDTSNPTSTNTPTGSRKHKRQEQDYFYIPKVVVFSSMNGGEPGIKELYSGDKDVLKDSIPGLTLLKYGDVIQLKKNNDKIDHAVITPEDGKWYSLVTSPPWVAWSVIMSIIYGIIIIISTHLLITHYNNCRFSISHAKYYCYPGIAFICIFGIILLLVDPGDVYEDRLSLFSRSLITNLKVLTLMVFFTILEVQWKNAASMICQTHDHHYKRILIYLNKLFSYILAFCIFIFILCFFIKTLSFLNTTSRWFSLMIKISYTLESVSIGLVGIEFVLFGSFIISAIKRRGRSQRLRYRKRRTAVKTLILNISFISAVIFFILSGAVQFLLPTLVNFWIQLVLGNIATATACIIIIVVLQDRTISEHIQWARERSADLQINTGGETTIDSFSISMTPQTPQTPPTPQTPQTSTSITSLIRNLTTINELPTENEMNVISSNRPSTEHRFNRFSGTNYSNRFSGTNNIYRYSGNYSNRYSSADDSNKRFSSARNSMYSMYTSVHDMTYSSQSYLDSI